MIDTKSLIKVMNKLQAPNKRSEKGKSSPTATKRRVAAQSKGSFAQSGKAPT